MSYTIYRFYQRNDVPTDKVKTGLTREEAIQHCNDPETNSKTATSKEAKKRTEMYGQWFDGFEEE